MEEYSQISYIRFINKEKKVPEKVLGVDDIAIINYDGIIEEIIVKSKFYESFLNQSCELVQSNFITGKILSVNSNFFSYAGPILQEYYSRSVKCDFLSEHKDFKETLSYTLLGMIRGGMIEKGKKKRVVKKWGLYVKMITTVEGYN